MSRAHTLHAVALVLACLGAWEAARAQETKAAPAPTDLRKLLETSEGAGAGPAAPAPAKGDDTYRPLTEAEKAGLIDKGRIAEETSQRLLNLKEQGNPHIEEGLDVGSLQEDPERVQVDPEKLREEQIREVENRVGFHGPEAGDAGDEQASAHDERAHEADIAAAAYAAKSERTGPGLWTWVMAGGILAAAIASLKLTNNRSA